jgi:hypothetical protein
MSQGEEDAAKAAILNKVMQGRPSDLMLRCNVSPSRNVIVLTGFVSQALYLMLMVNNFRKVEHDFMTLGNVKTISGQFKRAELCTEHQLNVGSHFFFNR